MKKSIGIFLLSFLFFASYSCKEESKFQLDPDATFSIKPDMNAFETASLALRSTSGHLSAIEIVLQTTVIRFSFNNIEWTRGFDVAQRDTTSDTPCLKMWATDIINTDGIYVPDFIEARNCVLEVWENPNSAYSPRDTIGYIPNAVLRAAELSIKEAYNSNDTERVYQIFNDAFTFRPVTGSEYRALMADSIN